jgi:hypothetical protein
MTKTYLTAILTITLPISGCVLGTDDAGSTQASISDPGDPLPPPHKPPLGEPIAHQVTGPVIVESGVTPGGAAWMRVKSASAPGYGKAFACDQESPGVWYCQASA